MLIRLVAILCFFVMVVILVANAVLGGTMRGVTEQVNDNAASAVGGNATAVEARVTPKYSTVFLSLIVALIVSVTLIFLRYSAAGGGEQ